MLRIFEFGVLLVHNGDVCNFDKNLNLSSIRVYVTEANRLTHKPYTTVTRYELSIAEIWKLGTIFLLLQGGSIFTHVYSWLKKTRYNVK